MKTNRRKICVVTGTRAEYGLLYWLMKEIEADPDLELQVVVTGMHLAPEFGLTYRQIESDGFKIAAKIENQVSSDTHVGMAKSTGLAVLGCADAFDRLKPDLVVVLGDRYETFAAAETASLLRVPLVHLHGGETTEGAVDESLRHAITKMANLHFVATELYRKRVIQMGEAPDRVYNVGAFGVDSIKRLKFLDSASLSQELNFKWGSPQFLVTYHPVTLEAQGPRAAMIELFAALDSFPQAHVLFTKPNSDAGGREISSMIDDYVKQHPDRCAARTSLGQLKYLSAVRSADVVIGNSSSGLLEAPYFGTPTVNIGDRQKGRMAPISVLHCMDSREAIAESIQRALSPQFKNQLKTMDTLFGNGSASSQTKKILATIPLTDLGIKKFHDLQETKNS